MLSEKMQIMLSEQIKKEYESAYLYLEISDFYENQGLSGFANWFKIQAREEVEHAMKFYNYLIENDSQVQFYCIQPMDTNFKDFQQPLELSLQHEQLITTSINRIYSQALLEEDYRTQIFLSWFIHEQIEEETNASNLINEMKLFGVNPAGLYQLNKQYEQRTFSPDKSTTLFY